MSRPNKSLESVTQFLEKLTALCQEHGILIDSNGNGDLTLYKKSGPQWRKYGYLEYLLDHEENLTAYNYMERLKGAES